MTSQEVRPPAGVPRAHLHSPRTQPSGPRPSAMSVTHVPTASHAHPWRASARTCGVGEHTDGVSAPLLTLLPSSLRFRPLIQPLPGLLHRAYMGHSCVLPPTCPNRASAGGPSLSRPTRAAWSPSSVSQVSYDSIPTTNSNGPSPVLLEWWKHQPHSELTPVRCLIRALCGALV